jgi:predicted DNA-binding antitoxin AbrB/MazE fold protein
MLNTVWAVIRDGKVELLESVVLPEGTKVLVTLVSEEGDAAFWQAASQKSLDEVWNNSEDDVYARLLEE